MRTKRYFWSLLAILSAIGCADDNSDSPNPGGGNRSDLSAGGTANCYVVNKPGDYSFDATTMGNGVPTCGISAVTLQPASADLLWQDAVGLIENVTLEDGRGRFEAAGTEGNALIAVKDAQSRILWSWHIWVTDYKPAADLDKTNMNGVMWMTRNLGAGSATWDTDGSVKGLIYQWGRKEPFPALDGWTDYDTFAVYDAAGNDISGNFETRLVSEAANFENAIRNPTVYYSGVRSNDGMGPYDWYTDTDYSAQNDYLWETESDAGKTLLDPCPPGWRVPRESHYRGLNNNSFPLDEALTGGRLHPTAGYFPAAGIRGFEGGIWTSIGSTGDYWTSTASENGFAHILHFLPSLVNPNGQTYRAAGLPVRCVSEKQDDTPQTGYDLEIRANRPIEAGYIRGDGNDGSSNYYVGFSNVEVTTDDQGQIVPASKGEIAYFDLYGGASEDAEHAVLPEGTYTLNSISNTGCATTDFTWIRYRESDADTEVKYHLFSEGKVVVTHTGTNGYRLEGSFVTTEDVKLHILCEGELEFVNRGAIEIKTVIENPVNTVFSAADIIYEHTSKIEDNPYDRYSINLWAGEMSPSGGILVDGYAVHIDMQTDPVSSKEDIQLKPGVYTAANDYAPGNFMRGAVYSLLGVPIYVGTYCQEVRPTNEAVLYGFADSGTIEVKRDGDNYEFVVDFVTPEGVSIKGTYPMGPVTLIDKSPEMPGGDWLSVLHEDKTMIFQETDNVYAYGYDYGEAYYPNSRHYEIYVNNHSTNESFYLAFLAPAEAASPAGTYTVAADPNNPVAGEFLPGYQNFAVLANTWCYVYFDETGYEAGGAPATEGELVITEAGDGAYRFELRMKDDAQPKNEVYASWTGPVKITSY